MIAPRVSVVIPCFNHGEFLPEAVASVLDAKRDDIELIVVDDGSTDPRTHAEMDVLRARGITVMRQENKGLAAARNAAIEAASGEYILPLDADNHVRPAYFDHGIRILDANPKVGVVYGDAQFIGDRSDVWPVGAFCAASLMRWNYIDACAIYRRKIWEQTGGYDGTMPVQGYEDWDLWIGAAEHGWEFSYVPEVLFDYRVSAGAMNVRAAPSDLEVQQFVTAKHVALYRREWEQLWMAHISIKATIRNLGRLLKLRFHQKVHNVFSPRHVLNSASDVRRLQKQFRRKKALEIGGPSEFFGDKGLLPVYSVLRSADNCLFSAQTIWTGGVDADRGFSYHPKKKPGCQLICDATDLQPVTNSSYEVVLASHCLEHVANPVRALEEWKRVLVEGGILVLVIPHKDGTFDWRRPVTPLGHMVEDYERGTREDDLTHLSEILELHDLKKDPPAGSLEQFKERCLANSSNRAMHHHVFDTETAVELVNYVGLRITRVEALKPFHIVVVAAKCLERPDNSGFLNPGAEFHKRSPFVSDHMRLSSAASHVTAALESEMNRPS